MRLKPFITKLRSNQKGFSFHMLLPVLVIVAIAGVGTYMLTASHAAINPQTTTYYYDSPGISHSVGAHGSALKYDIGGYYAWVLHGTADIGSGFGWYGPYRNMVVPQGANGIQACFRYSNQYATATPNLYIDITVRNYGGITLAKSNISPKRDSVDQSGVSSTQVTCIKYAAPPGSSLQGVEARLKDDTVCTNSTCYNASGDGFDLIRTGLSFY